MENVKVGEIFTLIGEDDLEQDIEVLATLTLEGNDYAAVAFADDVREQSQEDMDIFFLKVDSEGDLTGIDDDDEFTKVSTAFSENMG
ncbi:DUF1292 domain-containing protein [Rossellomorea vietnamensis]|uniref:DUF1292 domain-containing protein n=2 Tax=Rossellomorea TaxID=2837508 RepID=A0A5D4KE17_9BACI|nr:MULTISPECIES: DUF1292 domain-containing protein [Rossellomorea]TYR75119.1 DUF1292 domain-containing protein [Rossellomorea vietnamensis]TYS79875.1 DUF1292 domain-containing protein [Rossellomorea aquimaris]